MIINLILFAFINLNIYTFFSLKIDKPNLCVNCKYFLPNKFLFIPKNEFGKCKLFYYIKDES